MRHNMVPESQILQTHKHFLQACRLSALWQGHLIRIASQTTLQLSFHILADFPAVGMDANLCGEGSLSWWILIALGRLLLINHPVDCVYMLCR